MIAFDPLTGADNATLLSHNPFIFISLSIFGVNEETYLNYSPILVFLRAWSFVCMADGKGY